MLKYISRSLYSSSFSFLFIINSMKKSSKVNFLQRVLYIKLQKSFNCDLELNLNFFKTNSSTLKLKNIVFT